MGEELEEEAAREERRRGLGLEEREGEGRREAVVMEAMMGGVEKRVEIEGESEEKVKGFLILSGFGDEEGLARWILVHWIWGTS